MLRGRQVILLAGAALVVALATGCDSSGDESGGASGGGGGAGGRAAAGGGTGAGAPGGGSASAGGGGSEAPGGGTGAGGAPSGGTCVPPCLEELMQGCRATPPCTSVGSPTGMPERVCWGNGVTITYQSTRGMPTSHTHYKPDGSMCFYADTELDMRSGNVHWTIRPAPGGEARGELEFRMASPESFARARCTGGEWQDVDVTSEACRNVIQRPDGCPPGACPDPTAR